jgi:hypothetical protein
MSTDDRLEKLERFFKEVADLTVSHEVIAGEAVVLAVLPWGSPQPGRF